MHCEFTLTESDEDPWELQPEDFNICASADFSVEVDEINPMD